MEAIINKKAKFNYFLEEKFETGIVLQGWEIKPILSRKANLDNSYINIKDGELFLFNMLVSPLISTGTHIIPESSRSRKLLMKKNEIMSLIGKIERRGYTLIPTKVYRNKGKIKVEIALAKGKHSYDKRADEKDKDWKMEQNKLMKHSIKNS